MFVSKIVEGISQIGTLITSQIISRCISDVMRTSFTTLVITTFVTLTTKYVGKKQGDNKKFTQSQQNHKYKLLIIIILSTVGFFLRGIIPFMPTTFLYNFKPRSTVIV